MARKPHAAIHQIRMLPSAAKEQQKIGINSSVYKRHSQIRLLMKRHLRLLLAINTIGSLFSLLTSKYHCRIATLRLRVGFTARGHWVSSHTQRVPEDSDVMISKLQFAKHTRYTASHRGTWLPLYRTLNVIED